jgi:hypothetical protein
MRVGAFAMAAAVAASLPVISPAAPSGVDDRIAFSANGGTLTDTSGGGGGALAWIHNFNADALAGVAAEHQVIGTGHWTFGSLNGSYTLGPGDERYSLYAEVHEGAGDDGANAFQYRIETLGVFGTYYHRLSLQAEDKQIDIEKSHGNLPKLGISYLLDPHLQASANYSYSLGGNLGTRLTGLRIDGYTSQFNLLAGYTFGQAAPNILIFPGGDRSTGANASCLLCVTIPARQLHEGYIGVTKPLPQWRSEIGLNADYIDLSGSKRFTATLSYIFHIGGPR